MAKTEKQLIAERKQLENITINRSTFSSKLLSYLQDFNIVGSFGSPKKVNRIWVGTQEEYGDLEEIRDDTIYYLNDGNIVQVVTELPASLSKGVEIYLEDGGTLTKYVGNTANEPEQVVTKRSLLRYREYVAIINGDPTIPTNIEVISDDGLEPDITAIFDGLYRFTFIGEDPDKMVAYSQGATTFDDPSGLGISMIGVLVEKNNPVVSITSGNIIIDGSNTTFVQSGSAFLGTTLIVRVYD